MLLEHEGDYGPGRDVKGTVCSWKQIMVWDGCKGNRMLLEHEGDTVTVCSCNTKEIMYEPTPPNPQSPPQNLFNHTASTCIHGYLTVLKIFHSATQTFSRVARCPVGRPLYSLTNNSKCCGWHRNMGSCSHLNPKIMGTSMEPTLFKTPAVIRARISRNCPCGKPIC